MQKVYKKHVHRLFGKQNISKSLLFTNISFFLLCRTIWMRVWSIWTSLILTTLWEEFTTAACKTQNQFTLTQSHFCPTTNLACTTKSKTSKRRYCETSKLLSHQRYYSLCLLIFRFCLFEWKFKMLSLFMHWGKPI